MTDINIALLGASEVGKSTFVQRAFGLRQIPTGLIQALKITIAKVPYNVRLLELDLDDVELGDDERVRWPRKVEGQPMPPLDGVVTLYDVTDRESLAGVPGILNALVKASVPSVLVSSKCDLPASTRQVNPDMIEQAGFTLSGVDCYQASVKDADSQKRAVFALLRTIATVKAEKIKSPASRPRSNSTVQAEKRASGRRQSSSGRRPAHSRSNSELSSVPVFMHSAQHEQNAQLNSPPGSGRNSRSNGSRPPNNRTSTDRSKGSKEPKSPSTPRGSEWSDRGSKRATGLGLQVMTDMPSGANGRRVNESFLDSDDEKDDPVSDNDDVPILDRQDNESIIETPVKTSGHTFEELVERLLGQPMSKADSNFSIIFLCLYRKFATPGDLLDTIVRHFDQLEANDCSYMTKISSQLRHIGVLVKWTTEYPGDFAHPQTRSRLGFFISKLANSRVFAVAAKEMRMSLEMLVDDEDGVWGRADTYRRDYQDDSFLSATSSIRSSLAAASTIGTADELERQFSGMSTDTDDSDTLALSPTTPSIAKSTGNATVSSTGSSQNMNSGIAAAERQAAMLVPSPRTVLSKVQWHQFMESTDEDIATELTRIDWTMFSAIRPRDLIRHVSLPADKKENVKSVENVNRMINHFNHVAYWVANMIVLRDKPKHRALALEKFMSVAWKLRYRNNYNSLGAVIAGINGSAVHRLTQTRELVSHASQKDFMRLEILMGTQRSHFAYRLAWENTPSERIPFLPLHRRDLVSAEQGNRTYVGDTEERINWKKFEVMGDVIIGLQRSRAVPYTDLVQNVDIRRLILDCSFSKDDDALYDRSIQLEVPGAGANEANRKKFPWSKR